MYGMVHKAARSMCLEVLGEDAWAEILIEAELSDEHFINSAPYDDEITFRLVGAISEKSGMPMDELLTAFGRYRIGFTQASEYSGFIRMAGDNLETFCRNLNRMHAGITTSMPEARMPRFDVADANDDYIDVVYISPRGGLDDFTSGLLQGLGAMFSEDIRIEMTPAELGTRFRMWRSPLTQS